MNKKGFTLVELIATIAMVLALGLIVTPKVMNIINDNRLKGYKEIERRLEEATAKYIAENYVDSNARYISIEKDKLIEGKYIDEIYDLKDKSICDAHVIVTDLYNSAIFKAMLTCSNYVTISPTKINLKVYLNGGKTSQVFESSYDIGSVITLENPTKSGYTFGGWRVVSGDSELNGNELTINNIDTTIYAMWTNRIMLSVDLDGGTTSQKLNGNELTINNIDTTIYAMWTNRIMLSVDLDGGTTSQKLNGKYESDEVIVLQKPTKEGYEFAGWEVVSGNGIISGDTLTIGNEDTTIKATWKNIFNFNINLNEGSSSQQFASKYSAGAVIELVSPTKEGYVFAGWNVEGNGALLSGNTLTIGEGDVSLTAEWAINAEFAYTGGEQVYTAIISGYYKLEVWGASGGKGYSSGLRGGYGGYSEGVVFLNKDEVLYVNVGGSGITSTSISAGVTTKGGYNGGGSGYSTGGKYGSSGGGASHIAKVSGELNSLEDKKSSILIVAGGGGAGFNHEYSSLNAIGGDGGGASGTGKIPGGQSSGGGTFGQGYNNTSNGSGGGGGYYGGGGGVDSTSSGGGSGYIGNPLLTDKYMYCYNCSLSTGTDIMTISTTCANETTTENCAKIGNGYAKITFVEVANSNDRFYDSKDYDHINDDQQFIAPKSGYYKLQVWGAAGGKGYSSGLRGGYGGYSEGVVFLNKDEVLYVNVGGSGMTSTSISAGVKTKGGYNGGGSGSSTGGKYGSSGGGASHIAKVSGELNSLEDKKSSILVVAGGGGAGFNHGNSSLNATGGDGGGASGTGKIPGGQLSGGGTFGQGYNNTGGSGGGGGYYGGGGGVDSTSSGGGSGYIGNSLLTDKYMYCYNCTTSDVESTKTYTTTCAEETPTENCAKIGNGYAKITFVGKTLSE